MTTMWCPQCWTDREVAERWRNGLVVLRCGHLTDGKAVVVGGKVLPEDQVA